MVVFFFFLAWVAASLEDVVVTACALFLVLPTSATCNPSPSLRIALRISLWTVNAQTYGRAFVLRTRPEQDSDSEIQKEGRGRGREYAQRPGALDGAAPFAVVRLIGSNQLWAGISSLLFSSLCRQPSQPYLVNPSLSSINPHLRPSCKHPLCIDVLMY